MVDGEHDAEDGQGGEPQRQDATTVLAPTAAEAAIPPERLYARRSVLPGPDAAVGAVLAERRASLIADLGDDPSTAQLALVELAIRLWAMLDATDAYIVNLPSPVDRGHCRLWAVVVDRTRLHAQLESTLCKLGLQRRSRDVGDVAAELAAVHDDAQGRAS